MRSRDRRAGSRWIAILAVSLGAAVPATAQMQPLDTKIDLDYSYDQNHEGPAVDASAQFRQKYQLKLETGLTSSFDFQGALTVDLLDASRTGAASTSKISPSLELGVKGPQSAARFTYSGFLDTTDEYLEEGRDEKYSNSASVEFELTPNFWPEAKFKLQEQRDYQQQATDNSKRDIDLQLRDEIFDVRLDFQLTKSTRIETLPGQGNDNNFNWSLRAAYQETLPGDVNFDVSYEVRETYSEKGRAGMFAELGEDYTQSLKTRLGTSLLLTPKLAARVNWSYSFEQDLLKLDKDYSVENAFSLDISYDVLPSLKFAGAAKRDISLEVPARGGEEIRSVKDALSGAFDYDPIDWLRLGGKAEKTWDQKVEENTGGSVSEAEREQYELVAKNRFGDSWDLTLGTSTSRSYTNSHLDDQEVKFKAELRLLVYSLTWSDMIISPTYESSLKTTWDARGDRTLQTDTDDARIKFDLRALLLDYLKTSLSHEYGQKISKELDEVLNYKEGLDFNETTRLNVAVDQLWEELRLEGEIERRASDTEGDAVPQVVEVSYALRMDWKYRDLYLSTGFRYVDTEEDNLEFTAKVGWKGRNVNLSGDYAFSKTYSSEIEESRKLKLKLSSSF